MEIPSPGTIRHSLHASRWLSGKNNLCIAVSFAVPSGISVDGASGLSVVRYTSSFPVMNPPIPCKDAGPDPACPEGCTGKEE